MNHYQTKLASLKAELYANRTQLERVIRARNYLEQHFAEDVQLGTLAKMCFTSRFHFQRLFKRYYGQSPKQYLIDLRLRKSKELLSRGASVTETCFAVGFKSPGSFTAFFKRRTGRCPSTFRKEQLLRSEAAGNSRDCR